MEWLKYITIIIVSLCSCVVLTVSILKGKKIKVAAGSKNANVGVELGNEEKAENDLEEQAGNNIKEGAMQSITINTNATNSSNQNSNTEDKKENTLVDDISHACASFYITATDCMDNRKEKIDNIKTVALGNQIEFAKRTLETLFYDDVIQQYTILIGQRKVDNDKSLDGFRISLFDVYSRTVLDSIITMVCNDIRADHFEAKIDKDFEQLASRCSSQFASKLRKNELLMISLVNPIVEDVSPKLEKKIIEIFDHAKDSEGKAKEEIKHVKDEYSEILIKKIKNVCPNINEETIKNSILK